MIIEHYSETAGLNILRPQAGPDFPGNGAERKRAQDPDYLPRWYGYLAGSKPEPRIAQRPYKYAVRAHTGALYNLEADPKGLVGPDPTATEKAIYDAGYRGYYDVHRGIVAVFYAAPCVRL